jgi:hypothetical protein
MSDLAVDPEKTSRGGGSDDVPVSPASSPVNCTNGSNRSKTSQDDNISDSEAVQSHKPNNGGRLQFFLGKIQISRQNILIEDLIIQFSKQMGKWSWS